MAFPPPARWTGPPDWLRRGLARFVLWLHPVEYQWLGRVPEPGERILYVANHNLLALDTPHLWAVIYLSTGQWPRGLSDKLHFIVPGTSHLVWWLGGIRGDQTNCELAMQHGLPLLVFPGGTNEVLKKRHDAKYQLRWNDRRGFARYALKHGYTIVPVALIGIDDMCRIVGDVPLGWVARLAGDKRVDVTAPLVVPSGTWEKQYAVFGEPVEAAAFGAWDVEQDVVALRDKVRDTVQDLVAHALARRTADPERYLAPRLRSMIIGASRAGEA
ncbi:hypothetical protein HK105_203873 [Polyrhizophydium stewartii]|uniref:Phospholipid/glycerol acyltransferase domain-containing protein n=1 Tax=Polyrhizophydium stewartii TaxID=2732419 RepID=A0ABR4NAA1_9FUNG|nr:Transmembrane protein 68 [Polyrhizophydium stewartii]